MDCEEQFDELNMMRFMRNTFLQQSKELKKSKKFSSIQRMSHLIQNTLPLEGKPLINFAQKRFVKPNLKKIIRAQTQGDEISHQEFIDNLCFKLSGRQSIKTDKQNHEIYLKYKNQIKTKRKNTLRNSSQIQDIFTRDEERTEEDRRRRQNRSHINVLKYLQKMPEKVYLHQRYNNAINQRVNILQEIKQIQLQKKTYRQWSNQNSNSPIKSPNFTKMTFLLERLSNEKNTLAGENEKNNMHDEGLQKILDSTSKSKKVHSSLHRWHKSCIPNVTLKPIINSNYCPKNSSKMFQSKQQQKD